MEIAEKPADKAVVALEEFVSKPGDFVYMDKGGFLVSGTATSLELVGHTDLPTMTWISWDLTARGTSPITTTGGIE